MSVRQPHGLGPDGFVLGANLPWVTYGCDVGTNAWQPQGGLAAPGRRERLEADLCELAARGFHVVRWFTLCDGRAGVRFDDEGTPLGLDDRLLPDFEVAVRVADACRVRLWPVVLDFHWARPRRALGAVQLGGHGDTLRDEAKREALLQRVLAPVLRAFGREPAIWAWDLFNEPEWITLGFGAWNPFRTVEAPDVRAFVRDAVQVAHAETVHPVTVGSASAGWLHLVADLSLDFLAPHWYDRLDALGPLHAPATAWAGTHRLAGVAPRPIVLGEVPTRGSAHDVASIVATARAGGYGGAFLWSLRGSDASSGLAADVGGPTDSTCR